MRTAQKAERIHVRREPQAKLRDSTKKALPVSATTRCLGYSGLGIRYVPLRGNSTAMSLPRILPIASKIQENLVNRLCWGRKLPIPTTPERGFSSGSIRLSFDLPAFAITSPSSSIHLSITGWRQPLIIFFLFCASCSQRGTMHLSIRG